MHPLDFVWEHIGDVLTAPGGEGGQCTDLANLWLSEGYGLPHIYRNAVDWRNPIPRCTWVQNTPSNYPIPGCVVVWGPNLDWGIGEFGHVALALTADMLHIVSFDQNWPEHSAATLHEHDYRGILGWQRPGG